MSYLGELALVTEPRTSQAASMECANGAGAGAGAEVNRPKESDFREQVLQLAAIACHEDEEKSRIELLEKLEGCNKITLIELCRSFDIRGSTSTRKVDIVTLLMEFLMEHYSDIDFTDPDKKFWKRKRKRDGANLSGGDPSKKRKPDGTVLRTHSEEKADGKKRVEDRTSCSVFDLRDNRIVCTDNKIGQFSKEQGKPEPSEWVNGSALEKLAVVPPTGVPIPTIPCAKLVTYVENDTTDMKPSTKKNIPVTKKRATHKTDFKEKFGGKNVSKGDVKPQKQAVKPTKDELRQAVFCILDTANFATMTFGEVVKAVDKYFGKDLFERKPLIRALIEGELFRLAEEAEKKELEEEEAMEAKDRAEQAAKESAKDERVESYIEKEKALQADQVGKSKDAEKCDKSNNIGKGAGNGTSVEACVSRNSDAAAENSQDGKAEVDKKNEDNSDGFTKDGEAGSIAQNANGDDGVELIKDGKAETAKNCNGNTIVASEDVKAGEDEGTKDGRTEECRSGDDGNSTEKVGDCEHESNIELIKDGKAETAKNCNGNTIGASEDVKAGEDEGTKDGRTEECRSGDDGNSTEKVGDCEPDESNTSEKGEHVNCSEDGKSQEAGEDVNGENTPSCGAECGNANKTPEDASTEQSRTCADDDGKPEDAEHKVNTKVDVDSSNHGTAENGKAMDDAMTYDDGQA